LREITTFETVGELFEQFFSSQKDRGPMKKIQLRNSAIKLVLD